MSADAIQVYEGLDTLTAKPSPAELARLEHRLISFVPVDREFSVAEFAEHAHGEIDALAEAGRRADRGRRHGPLPARGAHGARPEAASGTGPARGDRARAGRGRRGAPPWAAAPAERRGGFTRTTASGSCGHSSSSGWGSSRIATSEQLWSTDLRRPAALFGIVMEREAIEERIRERAGRDGRARGRSRRSRRRSSGARRARRARRSASRRSPRTWRARSTCREARALLERRHLAYVKRQLTWMRKLAGVETIDRTSLSARETAAELVGRLDSLAPSR